MYIYYMWIAILNYAFGTTNNTHSKFTPDANAIRKII